MAALVNTDSSRAKTGKRGRKHVSGDGQRIVLAEAVRPGTAVARPRIRGIGGHIKALCGAG